jgi:hypothetical protein
MGAQLCHHRGAAAGVTPVAAVVQRDVDGREAPASITRAGVTRPAGRSTACSSGGVNYPQIRVQENASGSSDSTMKRHKVFISYAFGDSTAVIQLANELTAMGYEPWYAQEQLKIGHWRSKVETAIDSAVAVLLMISSESSKSHEVENEYRRAEAAKKIIMPVLIEECRLPLYAGALHHAKYYENRQIALDLIRDLIETAAANRRIEELAYLDRVEVASDQRLRSYARLAYKKVSEGVNTSDAESIASIIANLTEVENAYSAGDENLIGSVFQVRTDRSNSRVAIVGEAGAGKTTTLVRLQLELCRLAKSSDAQPIPLLVSLKKYSGSRPFIEYIQEAANRELGTLKEYFSELLESSRIALLIDGLNEVPKDGDVDARLREIKVFLSRNKSIFVAVTCLAPEYTHEHNLGLETCEILPLSPIQVRNFIGSCCKSTHEAESIFWSLINDPEAKKYLEGFRRSGGTDEVFWTYKGKSRPVQSYFSWELWLGVRDNPLSLLTLAKNPYLLTIIIQILLANRKPDSNKFELFSAFFTVLCQFASRSKRENADNWIDPEEQRDLLSTLASEMLIRGSNSLPFDDAVSLLGFDGATFLKVAEQEKILECGPEVSFTHQLLRAYFAASYIEQVWLGNRILPDFPNPRGWWHLTGWEEPVVFLVGKHARDPVRLLTWLRDLQPELASRCLIESGCQAVEPVLQSLATAWILRLERGTDQAAGRAAIGRALGRLNRDTRPGVSLVDGNGLPVIEWISVPGATLTMSGATSSTYVAEFEMSKYLVTNAHFATFIEDGGYSDKHRDCWTDAGWDWKLFSERRSPDNYTEIFRLSNHPRIGTVWYEVVAYSRWLTKRLREIGEIGSEYEIRLPTETEWEAAAKGPQGQRIYPWGNEFSYDRCNIRDIRSTTAVGIYPNGATPEGVCDMVGNAWSWCLTKWDNNPMKQDNDLDGDELRVYRGGSWAYDFNVSRWKQEDLMNDQRYWITPLDDRPDAIGFFLIKGRCLPP